MKKDRTYFRTMSWEGLKRWVKYADASEVDWQDLAMVLIEKAEQKMEDAYDSGRGESAVGYHHWG